MTDEWGNWLRKMYYENCEERENFGQPIFKNVDTYYRTNSTWLKRKFKEDAEDDRGYMTK